MSAPGPRPWTRAERLRAWVAMLPSDVAADLLGALVARLPEAHAHLSGDDPRAIRGQQATESDGAVDHMGVDHRE
jgi:hypothetical protein